ncbi:MAG: methylated-DNA--[protein]-cysteine S-methyltransferase [Thermodesulfobacteriota bacterium]
MTRLLPPATGPWGSAVLPLGAFFVYALAQRDAIGHLSFTQSGHDRAKARLAAAGLPVLAAAGWPILADLHHQGQEYLAGRRQAFSLPVGGPFLAAGTPWQQAVWAALRRIPYGATATYGQIAVAIGRPTAARAVGAACAANPLGLFIPCHRVNAARGDGGFAGGLACKRFLLSLEAKTTP